MDEIGNIKNIINIRDIKSSFIIKNIFSFLSEKQILNMVMYNQQFQKLLLVDITNYKKMSGKYKIGGINGKGKVYLAKIHSKDLIKLIFEEKYLNEKEKENYEREYLNEKGKEYYEKGELEFEGEYISGKKNGKGKEYNKYGVLEFEGEYINGKKMEKEKNIIIMVN